MDIEYEPNSTRPRTVTVDDNDILDAGDVDEAMYLIETEVQDHFNDKFGPDFDLKSVRAKVEQLFAEKAKED